MDRANKEQLCGLLRMWFEDDSLKVKAYCEDIVGKLLKEELMKRGHWRNLQRGNPLKGIKAKIAAGKHKPLDPKYIKTKKDKAPKDFWDD